MNRVSKIAIAFFGLAALPAWTINVEPVSVSVGGLSAMRPESNIGPKDYQKGPWREIHVEISQKGLRSLARWEPTFRLHINDCLGKWVNVEDLYFEGTSIELLRDDDAEVKMLRATGKPILLIALVEGKAFQENARLCASLSGGSMLGGAIKQYCFRLKPEPAELLGVRGPDPEGPPGETHKSSPCPSS